MDAWTLTTAERDAWVDAMIDAGRRVVAPAPDGGFLAFARIASAAGARLDGAQTARCSPKGWLFPQTEALLSFRTEGDTVEVEPAALEAPEQVLLGVRPCDAAGLERLDDVFLGGVADELYAARRAHTTVVALTCSTALPTCFCTAVGGSPDGTDGVDVQLTHLDGDSWLLRVVSERGAALAASASPGWHAASDADADRARARAAEVAAAITRTHEALPPDAPHRLAAAFAHPLWETLAARCLGCGVCAYVCPSCSCFDITDTASALCGTRCRSWDTCALAAFTKHASGHNPRTTQAARFRQRMLHKFSWFALEHGRVMCVGCGRCVELCPVGIDIHGAVLQALEASR